MSWSEWSPLKSDGSIPDELLPCSEWQARWFLEWDFDINDHTKMGDTLRGEWHWRVTSQDQQELFFSKVKVSVGMAWMYLGGILSLATWWWDSAADRLLTLCPEWVDRPMGRPISGGDPVPVWAGGEVEYGMRLWSASHPSTDTEQPYLNPGGGVDFANNTLYIQSWWEGPVYRVPLSVGSKWSVPFHNVGAPWLIKMANLQMRTRTSGDVDGLIDVPGVIRCGGNAGELLLQRISHDGGNTFFTRRIGTGYHSPQLLKGADNTLYCVAEKGGNWMLLSSANDGYTWEVTATVWGTEYGNAKSVILPDGSLVSVATKGSTCFFQSGITDTRSIVAVGTVIPPVSLLHDDRWGLVIVDSIGGSWISKDGGITWTARV